MLLTGTAHPLPVIERALERALRWQRVPLFDDRLLLGDGVNLHGRASGGRAACEEKNTKECRYSLHQCAPVPL